MVENYVNQRRRLLNQPGCDRIHVNVGEEQAFPGAPLEVFDAENERLKLFFLEGVGKGDLERRDRQASLLAEAVLRNDSTGEMERLIG